VCGVARANGREREGGEKGEWGKEFVFLCMRIACERAIWTETLQQNDRGRNRLKVEGRQSEKHGQCVGLCACGRDLAKHSSRIGLVQLGQQNWSGSTCSTAEFSIVEHVEKKGVPF